jgi:hypothetical protein
LHIVIPVTPIISANSSWVRINSFRKRNNRDAIPVNSLAVIFNAFPIVAASYTNLALFSLGFFPSAFVFFFTFGFLLRAIRKRRQWSRVAGQVGQLEGKSDRPGTLRLFDNVEWIGRRGSRPVRYRVQYQQLTIPCRIRSIMVGNVVPT